MQWANIQKIDLKWSKKAFLHGVPLPLKTSPVRLSLRSDELISDQLLIRRDKCIVSLLSEHLLRCSMRKKGKISRYLPKF